MVISLCLDGSGSPSTTPNSVFQYHELCKVSHIAIVMTFKVKYIYTHIQYIWTNPLIDL